jgi:glycosyltransferase involved in cell wall biosynthesis
MPIRWDEPFGMVMVEALACGTPVIAFPEGAAVEIVQDGLNGYLVDDEDAMAAAVARLARINAPIAGPRSRSGSISTSLPRNTKPSINAPRRRSQT